MARREGAAPYPVSVRRSQVIGQNNVAVPTHFFKVVVGEVASGGGDLEMEAYVMPNEAIPDSAPIASFQVICKRQQLLSTSET